MNTFNDPRFQTFVSTGNKKKVYVHGVCSTSVV